MGKIAHRWKLDRTQLAKEGANVQVEIANRASSRESGFNKRSGLVLIDTGADRSGINEKYLNEVGAKQTGERSVRVVGGKEEKRPLVTCYLRFVRADNNAHDVWERDCEIEVISLSECHPSFGILGRDLLHCGRLCYDGVAGEIELVLSEEE